MRYPAAEKLEIIRLVEQSPLPVRHTVAKLGIPRAIFYRWYDRYSRGGPAALDDRSPRPDRVWNRIPEPVRQGNREGRVETEVLDLTDRAAAAAWIAEIERTTGGAVDVLVNYAGGVAEQEMQSIGKCGDAV
jgi:transposase-like protein